MWKVDDSREEERMEEVERKQKKSFKNSIWSEKKEIEFINIDTDGRDFYFDSSIVHFFPLTLLWLCYPISKFFFSFFLLFIHLIRWRWWLACLLTCRVVFCILYRYLLSIWDALLLILNGNIECFRFTHLKHIINII